MEVFKVNKCTEELIDLTSEPQLETLLACIKDSQEVMIRWINEEDGSKKSKILLTDSLMSKLKDGRLVLTATKPEEDN